MIHQVTDGSFPILGVEALPPELTYYERLGFERTYVFPPEGEPAFVTPAGARGHDLRAGTRRSGTMAR